MASKMWAPFFAMGFMIVMATFIYGLVNSSISADYFQISKETREAAVGGWGLATQKAFMESTKAWLPDFKLSGMRMILGGATFLLVTILGALRTGVAEFKRFLASRLNSLKRP